MFTRKNLFAIAGLIAVVAGTASQAEAQVNGNSNYSRVSSTFAYQDAANVAIAWQRAGYYVGGITQRVWRNHLYGGGYQDYYVYDVYVHNLPIAQWQQYRNPPRQYAQQYGGGYGGNVGNGGGSGQQNGGVVAGRVINAVNRDDSPNFDDLHFTP